MRIRQRLVGSGQMPRNITQVMGDVRALPFPDDWFDCVVCVSCIEHITLGRDRAVAEMARVVKPGGRLLFTMDMVTGGGSFGIEHIVTFADCERILTELGIDRFVGGDDEVPAMVMPMAVGNVVVVLVKWIKPMREVG